MTKILKMLLPREVVIETETKNIKIIAYQKAMRYMMNALILKEKAIAYQELLASDFNVNDSVWEHIDEPRDYFLQDGKHNCK